MASSDYLPFATGGSANVESQGSYAGSSIQVNGFQTGLAPSNAMNKALRQSSVVAAAIAQFIVDQLGINVPDDGNLNNLKTNFKSAIWASAALTGVPTAPTPATSDNSTKIASTAYARALIALILANSPALGGNPTAPTAPFGDNSASVANTAFVQGALPTIQGIAGGITLGPLYIQAGINNVGSGGTIISFPTAFPNACLITIACPAGSAPSTVGVVTFNQFFWEGVGPAGVVACCWFAIGY